MKRYESEAERSKARAEAVKRATSKWQASKKRVNAYFDEEEFSHIQAASDKLGISAGRFVREAALKAAKRGK